MGIKANENDGLIETTAQEAITVVRSELPPNPPEVRSYAYFFQSQILTGSFQLYPTSMTCFGGPPGSTNCCSVPVFHVCGLKLAPMDADRDILYSQTLEERVTFEALFKVGLKVPYPGIIDWIDFQLTQTWDIRQAQMKVKGGVLVVYAIWSLSFYALHFDELGLQRISGLPLSRIISARGLSSPLAVLPSSPVFQISPYLRTAKTSTS